MEIRPQELVKQWRAGKFHAAYYFLGEPSAAAELISQLKALLKPDPFHFSEFRGEIDARAVVADALTPPAFLPRRLVVVDSPRLAASARAELARYLEAPLETTTLVLWSDEKKIDPKDALARAALAKGAVCRLFPLKEEEACARLQDDARKAGKTMDPEAAQALVGEAGTDWTILRQELEKILLFTRDGSKVSRAHVLECLGFEKAADPWALSRLIQGRALKESLRHLRKTFDQGKAEDAAFRALAQIVSAVSKQWRAKRLMEAGARGEALFKALRLNAYYDQDFPAQVSRMSSARLKRDLAACLETEVSLKSKAWLDPRQEIEKLIIALCRPAAAPFT